MGGAAGQGGGRVTFRTGEPATSNTRDPRHKWIFQGDIFDMNESYIRNKRLKIVVKGQIKASQMCFDSVLSLLSPSDV